MDSGLVLLVDGCPEEVVQLLHDRSSRKTWLHHVLLDVGLRNPNTQHGRMSLRAPIAEIGSMLDIQNCILDTLLHHKSSIDRL